ncbi:MarR family transcriptional regulator [Methanobrevibacter sp.]|uniref:MarR family transcriptional regulator n=1 Tax=Methanobrevibacter sp. TaxID=66852 RepID=UPI0038901007
MFNDEETQAYDQAFAFVKRSKNRQHVIRILSTDRKTPSEITETMDARFSLISKILSDLKSRNIVVCINEDDKTGRLYKLTDIGLEIYKELESS